MKAAPQPKVLTVTPRHTAQQAQLAFANAPDQADLFAQPAAQLEAIPLPDAELYFSHRASLSLAPDQLFTSLLQETPWRSETITLYGKTHLQPRLIAWYGDSGANYKYGDRPFPPLPWTPLLWQLKQEIEALTGYQYNSVLLNFYRDENDSVGMHADDERELGDNPAIASLSLGATRCFHLKHKTRKELKPMRIMLEHGSLLLMAGAMQRHWLHGISKESRSCAARINLTFRLIMR